MDLDYLRTATRPEHEGTEATVPLMDPALTRAQYAATLTCMYRAVRGWDDWSLRHAPERLKPLLAGRQRSALIEADLRALHAAPPVPPVAPQLVPWMPDQTSGGQPVDAAEFEARFLGAMYVIEGSTLGGQYIARHAEEMLKLAPGEGNAYFRGYGEQTGSMWRSFKAVLAEVPDRYTEVVVDSAKAMFGFFAAQMADSATEST